MAYSVRLTPKAAHDAEQIFRRVVEAAPLAAQKWFNQLVDSLYSLSEFPQRCEIVEGLNQRGDRVVRKLLYGRKPHTYRVYFEVVDNTVCILHIRHGARREPRLKELLGQ